MGNCQAAEAATAIVQHPGGKVERLYWPTTAAEVTKNNPGHYVALVTLYVSQSNPNGGGPATVRFTRVKLLKPKDMLLLGQVYRLVTSQEVAKAIRARKDEKMKKKKSEEESLQNQQQKSQQSSSDHRRDNQRVKDRRRQHLENTDQQAAAAAEKPERQRNSTQKARQWRPSLHSISEVGSQSLI